MTTATPTKPRQFDLYTRGGYVRIDSPHRSITDAIHAFEAETGQRVIAGQSVDNGPDRFDDAADLEEFMRTHRGGGQA